MVKLELTITPCRTSMDSIVRLHNVYRDEHPEDLTSLPDEAVNHVNVTCKRSLFISPRNISLTRLDRVLLQDLTHIGRMTQEAATNVLLVCKCEIAGYCEPNNGDYKVRCNADLARRGDNQVKILIEVKRRKTIPVMA